MNTNDQYAFRTETPPYDGYHKYDRAVAQDYESTREKESHWGLENQFIEDYFKGRQVTSLLDLPVGTGRFFGYYEGVRQLTGVDISEDMLAEAKKKLPLLPEGTSARLERGDVFDLHFSDREFDTVVVMRLFHLIPQDMLTKAVRELCRVSRGDIILQTYVPPITQRSTVRKLVSWLRRRFRPRVQSPASIPACSPKPWSHIQAYLHKQARIDELFAANGFSPSKTQQLATYENSSVVNVTIYSSPDR